MNLLPPEIARLEKLEKIIEDHQEAFFILIEAVHEIREKKLYRADYNSFEAYCQGRWGWGRRRGDQLAQAAAIIKALPENCEPLVRNERVVREIAKIPPPQRAAVVEAVAANGPVTAAAIRKWPIPPPPSPPAPVEVLDETGWPVSPLMLPLYRRGEEIQELLTYISALRGKLKELEDEGSVLVRNVSFGRVRAGLNDAWTELKSAKPYTTCPSCKGNTPEVCGACKGTGFISESYYKINVPEETKVIRAKAMNEKNKK